MARKMSKITKESPNPQRNHMYLKDDNHKYYKVKSQTQMRKYRKQELIRR